MPNIYITSSERYAGKTFVSAGLAATMQSLGYATSYYNPIQMGSTEKNGFMQSPDIAYMKTIDPYINTHCTYLFKEDSEPLLAAESGNEPIDINLIIREYKKISSNSECTVIDGTGGLLSPLAPNIRTIDLIKLLGIPVLIVVKPNNNAINNTLLTIQAAQERDIPVRGVIINVINNDCSKNTLSSIPRVIEEYTNVKILGIIPNLNKKILPEDIIPSVLNGIDIESVFNVKIEKLEIN